MFLGSSFIPDEMFALYFFQSSNFYYFQIISYMFVHANFMHLLMNMFGLYMFGSILEKIWGGQRFLFFYLFCGVGAGLLHEAIQYFHDYASIRKALELALANPNSDFMIDYFNRFGGSNATNGGMNATAAMENYSEYTTQNPVVGASGGVFGILMAYGYLFPNSEMFVFPLPIPIKAKYLVMGFAFYELYAGKAAAAGDNVAHFAHLGGMLFAVILLLIWRQKRDSFY
jgi:membrane associated rhomboid family serine protease